MLFRLTHPLPERCLVAVSGGPDSMAAWHWLSQVPGRVQGIVHLNHNSSDFSARAEKFVQTQAEKQNLPLYTTTIRTSPPEGQSLEEFWRNQRYGWFRTVANQTRLPIILAHQLGDCLEEYVVCTMIRGYQGTIPYQHGPCIRPFRLWDPDCIFRYLEEHQVQRMHDPSNLDERFLRNRVRRYVVPEILRINPGLSRIVEGVMREQDQRPVAQSVSAGRS